MRIYLILYVMTLSCGSIETMNPDTPSSSSIISELKQSFEDIRRKRRFSLPVQRITESEQQNSIKKDEKEEVEKSKNIVRFSKTFSLRVMSGRRKRLSLPLNSIPEFNSEFDDQKSKTSSSRVLSPRLVRALKSSPRSSRKMLRRMSFKKKKRKSEQKNDQKDDSTIYEQILVKILSVLDLSKEIAKSENAKKGSELLNHLKKELNFFSQNQFVALKFEKYILDQMNDQQLRSQISFAVQRIQRFIEFKLDDVKPLANEMIAIVSWPIEKVESAIAKEKQGLSNKKD